MTGVSLLSHILLPSWIIYIMCYGCGIISIIGGGCENQNIA